MLNFPAFFGRSLRFNSLRTLLTFAAVTLHGRTALAQTTAAEPPNSDSAGTAGAAPSSPATHSPVRTSVPSATESPAVAPANAAPAPVTAANAVPAPDPASDNTPEKPKPLPKEFGDAGVLVLGASLGVHTLSFSNSSASQFGYNIEPSVDYFIGKPLSLGGFVLLRHSDNKSYDPYGPLIESKETGYGIGFRMGLNFKLNDTFSVWPKLLFGFTHYSEDVRSSGYFEGSIPLPSFSGSSTVDTSYIEAQLPLIAQLVPHFFAGVGPTIFTDLSRSYGYSSGRTVDNKRTGTSLALTLGGWI